MTIYIDVRIIYVIGSILFFGLGYFLSNVIWEKKYNSLVDSLPVGKTLFLGELSDSQCEEVVDIIKDYASKNNTSITFMYKENSDKS